MFERPACASSPCCDIAKKNETAEGVLTLPPCWARYGQIKRGSHVNRFSQFSGVYKISQGNHVSRVDYLRFVFENRKRLRSLLRPR